MLKDFLLFNFTILRDLKNVSKFVSAQMILPKLIPPEKIQKNLPFLTKKITK